MKWYERLKTKISVGERYEMRNGTKWTVSEMRDEEHFLIDKDKPKDGDIDISMRKQLVVGNVGNFGNYPNPFDLVKRIS